MSSASLFEVMGYLRLPATIDDQMIDEMDRVIRAHAEAAVKPFRVNKDGALARLDRLLERDPIFTQALRSEPVRGPVAEILGPCVEAVRHRHNHATFNRAGDIPYRLHRDIQQWSQPLVSIFFFLEDSTVQNGCTRVVPGSHRLPYAGPQSGGGGGNWADEHDDYKRLMGQELPIEMPRGGILLINSLAFHTVGTNLTAHTRLSCVFALRAVDELATSYAVEDGQILFGRPRNLSNDTLDISGSLQKGE